MRDPGSQIRNVRRGSMLSEGGGRAIRCGMARAKRRGDRLALSGGASPRNAQVRTCAFLEQHLVVRGRPPAPCGARGTSGRLCHSHQTQQARPVRFSRWEQRRFNRDLKSNPAQTRPDPANTRLRAALLRSHARASCVGACLPLFTSSSCSPRRPLPQTAPPFTPSRGPVAVPGAGQTVRTAGTIATDALIDSFHIQRDLHSPRTLWNLGACASHVVLDERGNSGRLAVQLVRAWAV